MHAEDLALAAPVHDAVTPRSANHRDLSLGPVTVSAVGRCRNLDRDGKRKDESADGHGAQAHAQNLSVT
jgi:hypothetical protein